MNKVFLLIAFYIFSVLTVNAQTLNDKILKGCNWERLNNDETSVVVMVHVQVHQERELTN